MSVKASGGSPVAHPQQYQTLPIAVISQAEQQDRCLKRTELNELNSFFSSGRKLLEIAQTLTQNADQIVYAGASRIFVGGSPMAYLEKPQDPVGLPGSGYFVAEDYLTAARSKTLRSRQEALKVQTATNINPIGGLWERLRSVLAAPKASLFDDKDPLPSGFHFINVSRYGPTRMKRSMRDLSWFLRYVTYAVVAGDSSILSVNVRGLRGIIPEDVTEATVVALREMRRKALTYFNQDVEAANIIKQHFDVLITEYLVEKPSAKLRIGVSNDQQGLELPQSYFMAALSRPKFVMKPNLSVTQKQDVLKAAYRQVFERDITDTYGFPRSELESQVNSGNISIKEFIRKIGKSKLYRRLFYEPFTLSRVVELAMRHFLGRGLSSREEFQDYFAIISSGGLPALVDALVDSPEYADYFGEETVPYLRGLGQEAQECRNWGPQFNLFQYSAPIRKVPQFITLFGSYTKPLPDQHPYGVSNDPLEIQFGAIFPSPREHRHPHTQPAFFSKDTRRILINCGSGTENGLSNHAALGKAPGSLGSRVFKLDQLLHANGNKLNGSTHAAHQSPSVSLSKNSLSAVIQGAYRQVIGRDVYESQRLTTAEVKLKGGEITMREFIRQLAKSKVFRSLYWETLYITKAIEYIHRRLLGRPTYGRSEMNRYYDIAARKGFYALIDEIIDSSEYIDSFGEDTVPYERYLTPKGYAMRCASSATSLTLRQLESELQSEQDSPRLDKFIAQKPAHQDGMTPQNSQGSVSTATLASRLVEELDAQKPEQEAVLTPLNLPITDSKSEENNEYS